MTNFIKGIAVSGEQMATIKDKSFTVVGTPHYVDMPSLEDPKKREEKLVMSVEISLGIVLDYLPNKTSQKTMVNAEGFDLDKWLGKSFTWEVTKQKAFGKEMQVLYVLPRE